MSTPGELSQAMRDKSREALRLFRTQPLSTVTPPAEGEPATLNDSMRDKARQAAAIYRATYGGTARQVTVDGQ